MDPRLLTTNHTYVMRLLEHSPMDVGTLVRASFGTKSQVEKILDELVRLNLVERRWNGSGFVYKTIK